MKGYRLSLIRHGFTEANETGMYIGSKTDLPLSKKGKDTLLNYMDEYRYPRVERVYTSPLLRCRQTCDILFPDRQVIAMDDLKELNFGDFDGKTVDELIDRDDYKHWLKGGLDNAPPNGESIQELVVRSYNALTRIIVNMMDEEFSHCAIVTHSGVIKNILTCFGLPKINPNDIYIDAGEGAEILVTADMWQRSQAFEILGKVPYLPDDIEFNTYE
ncbi:MAG: histidine phosphatase family protein [Ruminococcus sp.]|nr:histidine phosphatase family protein [Ruminococcus sp.]MCD7801020.1 histidine phosphatase family protein [Ruminococcus sp.]